MKEEKNTIGKIYLFGGFGLFLFGLVYIFFSGLHDEKMMREHGVDTECVMDAYGKGSTGTRERKEGYVNRFVYQIGDSIHHCYVFTSIKPLPFGLKLQVRYLVKKDGSVTIDFPDEYEEKYKEYGFNDYGH